MEQIDPLNMPASNFITPLHLNLGTDAEPDLFLDGDRFMSHLGANYDSFDVMTYSCSKSMVQPLVRINRMIYGLKQRMTCVKPKEKKFMMNNHVKMFVCYWHRNNQESIEDVFVGSQNLTHGTNLNLMYRVREEHVEQLVAFFNKIWKAL